MRSLEGNIAEFERDLIRERTAAGMRAAKRRGARIGRPRATVDRVALIQGVRAGLSVVDLARRLDVSRDGAVAKRVVAGEPKTATMARGAVVGELRVWRPVCCFEELLARYPNFELAGEPELLPSRLMHGVERLPVAFWD